MDLLARREHSHLELRTKLSAREFSAEEVEAAVTGLSNEGLLSDQRFTESFVAARLRKGQGPLKIRAELGRRGIEGSVIDESLSGVDWDGYAREARARKFGAAPPAEYREAARQARFLEGRGFTAEQIALALAAAAEEN